MTYRFLALVLVGTRVRSSTLPDPFPDLNPIPNPNDLGLSTQFYIHFLQHHLLYFLFEMSQSLHR